MGLSLMLRLYMAMYRFFLLVLLVIPSLFVYRLDRFKMAGLTVALFLEGRLWLKKIISIFL